jgi:hypothetical protein
VSRRLQWGPSSPRPQHLYRDTLLTYGTLAVVIVLFAWLTGGSVGQAAAIAALFFLVACAWSGVRWRRRLGGDADARGAKEADL